MFHGCRTTHGNLSIRWLQVSSMVNSICNPCVEVASLYECHQIVRSDITIKIHQSIYKMISIIMGPESEYSFIV